MPPPCYADLSSSARDLFEKHFKFGLLNFDFKSKTSNNVDIHINGNRRPISNALATFLEMKTILSPGVRANVKLTSNWVTTFDLEAKGKLHPNLKHNLVSVLEKETGNKSLTAKTSFSHDIVNAGLDLGFTSKYPLVTGSLVCKDYSAGVHAVFDSAQMIINRYQYAFNCRHDDIHACISLTNHSNIDLNVFHSIDNLDVGFKLGWTKQNSATSYGAALMYRPCKNSFIKAKVDQDSIVGLAYGIKANPES
ncbi:unnamed protein product [Protopolystoma xenopodis]|uniref:Voltage-dependent anion-selective channel protein 3 n=1 Tax=Protopolystoma xenopodis TaxID=117903 RepID=A0A3S5CM16_9PLAT|nr:unnamed protein product [Protopolystoma xenopodis]